MTRDRYLNETPSWKIGPRGWQEYRMDEKNEKLEWSLITPGMWRGIKDVVRVMMDGKKKYPRDNWITTDKFTRNTVCDSMLRHLISYIEGYEKDKYSGLPHLAHLVTNALFLLSGDMYWQRNGVLEEPKRKCLVILRKATLTEEGVPEECRGLNTGSEPEKIAAALKWVGENSEFDYEWC